MNDLEQATAVSIFFLLILILPGCSSSSSTPDGVQPIVSGTQTVSVLVDGVERKYILHVPTDWQYKSFLPVVLMFHGGGGTARGAILETGLIDLADEECFLLVFPEGMPPNPALPSSFSGNPQRWNDGSDRFNLNVDDVAFVEKIREDLDADFSVDPNRIFATGFSNGASMAFRVGVELSDIFAAIGPIAGALWLDDFTLHEPVSLMYTTGTEDTLNPLDGGQPKLATGEILNEKEKPPVREHMEKWSEALGCDETPFPLVTVPGITGESYANCLDTAEVVYYEIEGMGHAWPGGISHLPETMVGETSDLMDATRALWDFFQDHPKP